MKKIIIAVILFFIAFSASAQLHADLRVGATASSFGDRHLKWASVPEPVSNTSFQNIGGFARGFFSR